MSFRKHAPERRSGHYMPEIETWVFDYERPPGDVYSELTSTVLGRKFRQKYFNPVYAHTTFSETEKAKRAIPVQNQQMSKRSFADAYGGVSDASLLAAYPKRRPVKTIGGMSAAMYASRGAQAYRRNQALERLSAGRLRRAALVSNSRTGGFLGIETKFFDSGLAATAIGNTVASAERDPATDNCLNAVVQGDGPSNRDGNRYIIKRVTVKGQVTCATINDSAGAPSDAVVFVALVQDKQTNGAQLNSEDVFSVSTVASVPQHLPFRNQEFLSRFNVLASHTMTFKYGGATPSAGGDYPGMRQAFSFDKALQLRVQCNGTTGPVSTVTDNSLHIIAISSGNSIADQTIEYNSRILFQG